MKQACKTIYVLGQYLKHNTCIVTQYMYCVTSPQCVPSFIHHPYLFCVNETSRGAILVYQPSPAISSWNYPLFFFICQVLILNISLHKRFRKFGYRNSALHSLQQTAWSGRCHGRSQASSPQSAHLQGMLLLSCIHN